MKGKAAIDVVCNPLGKSGGALIQQVRALRVCSLVSRVFHLLQPRLTRCSPFASSFTTNVHDIGVRFPCGQHPVRALRVARFQMHVE